jgi:hypothetical protein
MKFSLGALALAPVASAATINNNNNKRDVVFEVRNFTASCVPHSAMCQYVPYPATLSPKFHHT